MSKSFQHFIYFIGSILISLFINLAIILITSFIGDSIHNQKPDVFPPLQQAQWWASGLPFKMFHHDFETKFILSGFLADIGFWSIIFYKFLFKQKILSAVVLIYFILFFIVPLFVVPSFSSVSIWQY